MRIAIIEDDEITRLELSKLLNTQGYETVLLTNFENLPAPRRWRPAPPPSSGPERPPPRPAEGPPGCLYYLK